MSTHDFPDGPWQMTVVTGGVSPFDQDDRRTAAVTRSDDESEELPLHRGKQIKQQKEKPEP